MSAWLEDNKPLASFLSTTYADVLATAPVRFAEKQDGAILHTMKSGERYIAMIIRGSMTEMKAELIAPMVRRP